MTTEIKTHTFTVDDLYSMLEAGIITEDDRLELIEGELIDMTPIGRGHSSTVTKLIGIFSKNNEQDYLLRVQAPVRLDKNNEPEPDIALVTYKDDYYASGHPDPADVRLIVEVAEASVEFDTGKKLDLYARFEIPEVWVVDLKDNLLRVYREPVEKDGAYHETDTRSKGDRIEPVSFPDFEIMVSDILK